MVANMKQWWLEFKIFDQVKVYNVDVSDTVGHEDAALRWLDETEIARSDKFLLPEPKRRFVLCRAALRSILCDLIGCGNADLSFEEAEKGKPYATLKGQIVDIGFNVSHSGDYGLIAVGEIQHLGIDIEQRRQRRDLDLLLSTVLAPAEKAHIALADDQRKHDLFFDYWTVKEAVLKAVGVGMSLLDPSQIEVPREMLEGSRSCIAQFPQIGTGTWRIENIGTTDFAAAMAYVTDET